jgi:hypothetical protein
MHLNEKKSLSLLEFALKHDQKVTLHNEEVLTLLKIQFFSAKINGIKRNQTKFKITEWSILLFSLR